MLGIPKHLEMFTEEEKQKIWKEFTFNDCEKLNRNFDPHIEQKSLLDFTDFDLNQTEYGLLKNSSTKSVILAPFNSSVTDLSAPLKEDIKQMIVDVYDILQFGPMVKEINRKYEENNN